MTWLVWYWTLVAVAGLSGGLYLSRLYRRIIKYIELLQRLNPKLTGLDGRQVVATGMYRTALGRCAVHLLHLCIGIIALTQPTGAGVFIAFSLTFTATIQMGLTLGELYEYHRIMHDPE